MPSISIPIWKKAPFVRLLMPLILGILLQWYFQFEWTQIILTGCGFIIALLLFRLLPLSFRFKLQPLLGLLINLIIVVLGLLLTYQKDIRHQESWFGNSYHDGDYLIVTVNQPLEEKPKSFKAEGSVNTVLKHDTGTYSAGKLLLYFEKDSAASRLGYGTKILLRKNLQSIRNSGNPAAFDYQRYLAFQQIFHQVYLKSGDWVLLADKNINVFNQFIYEVREYILQTLRKNIKGKNESAIAEALLIGYKTDLDKDLVQAYSNTGVVHIIAISGLHLGLIYFMLVGIFDRIPYLQRSKIAKAVLILISLWLFALLTGASASVLRSAVMFSCIVAGESFQKKSSVYNSLATSAFLLLCYNPFFLWDVGFQLSYLAVLGIVIFQKPVYNWIYIKNKWVNKAWKLLALSLAAQIFTFPVCLYYFHQFPNLFLVSNLIAVPLSSVILFAEIFLIATAKVPFIIIYSGKIVTWLIWLMNKIITGINDIPFAVSAGISSTLVSTIIMYCFVCCTGAWLLNKNKSAFIMSLAALLALLCLNAYSKWNVIHQQKVVVYNIPRYQAIDFINGNQYMFIGDSVLAKDGILQNFHMKPARIAMQLNKKVGDLKQSAQKGHFFRLRDKVILLIDSSFLFEPLQEKIDIDVAIISKNPAILIEHVAATFKCGQYVFDASNSLWKIEKWKEECRLLNFNFYSVPENGAFITDL